MVEEVVEDTEKTKIHFCPFRVEISFSLQHTGNCYYVKGLSIEISIDLYYNVSYNFY